MDAIKKTAVAVSVVIILPVYLGVRVCMLLFGSERAFGSAGTMLSLVPGIIGDFLRKAYYLLLLDGFSTSAGLGFGSFFSHRRASMGPGSSCGAYCILGTCQIGAGVLLGSNVHLLSGKGQHSYDADGKLIDGSYESIAIGDNTWIGNGAIIMAPVGNNCIVGAGSVVTQAIPDNSIVVGNPGRVVKTREA